MSSGSLYIITSTFSTTSMASSTTIPMARISPNSVKKFILNPPAICIAAKAPISETGIVAAAIIVGLQEPKKMKIIIITRAIAI